MSDIEYLIENYYKNSNVFSQETSSHWKKYGAKQEIEFNLQSTSQGNAGALGLISIKGEGFGDFKKLSVFNLLASIPVFFYLALILWPKLRKSTLLKAINYSIKSKQIPGFDVTRMALTIDYLTTVIGNLNDKSITIIGDGYGRLGSLLKLAFPSCKIIYINLGRTLTFDYYYTYKVFPNLTHKLVHKMSDFVDDFNYIEAEKYASLDLKSDIFMNIASMQEMDMKQIEGYFNLIRSQEKAIFYCCNRLSKSLPDNSLINFNDYPWAGFEILTDELCPWHQKFPSIKPPFVRSFDGPIQHRVVRFGNFELLSNL
jgi:hypothetical protein